MIEKDLIAFLHFLQVVACLKVPNSGPVGPPVSNQIVERICFGFLFDQPIVHRSIYSVNWVFELVPLFC